MNAGAHTAAASDMAGALAALYETLTVLDSIDYVADDIIRETVEDAVKGELIRACTMRIRAVAEPFLEAAEASRTELAQRPDSGAVYVGT